MNPTLYVEIALCPFTGAVGWGAVVIAGRAQETAGGLVQAFCGQSSTLAELAGLQQAFQAVTRHGTSAPPYLSLATRSTAAMAVLQWVMPKAPRAGVVVVQSPKKLKAEVRDFQPIYDLYEDIARAGVQVRLLLTAPNEWTEIARGIARTHMEAERQARQRRGA